MDREDRVDFAPEAIGLKEGEVGEAVGAEAGSGFDEPREVVEVLFGELGPSVFGAALGAAWDVEADEVVPAMGAMDGGEEGHRW